MAHPHLSRSAAAASALTLLASLALLSGASSASAAGCTGAPDLLLTQAVTSTSSSVAYDVTVTNDGTCGATDVAVTVQLPPSSTYTGFAALQRSWSCTLDTGNKVDCLLQSQLDQKSTQSSGASGTASVRVRATPPAGGNKNNPPEVGESALVTDTADQVPPDSDDMVWYGAINPKTGGTVSTGISPLETSVSHTVTVPPGTAGVVNLAEQAVDPSCVPGTSPVASCTSDLFLNAPSISNGYSTIVMRFYQATQPPPPAYDEGSGVQLMLPCKGKVASPPCWYSTKSGTSSSGPYFDVTIRDSGGTHMWG